MPQLCCQVEWRIVLVRSLRQDGWSWKWSQWTFFALLPGVRSDCFQVIVRGDSSTRGQIYCTEVLESSLHDAACNWDPSLNRRKCPCAAPVVLQWKQKTICWVGATNHIATEREARIKLETYCIIGPTKCAECRDERNTQIGCKLHAIQCKQCNQHFRDHWRQSSRHAVKVSASKSRKVLWK